MKTKFKKKYLSLAISSLLLLSVANSNGAENAAIRVDSTDMQRHSAPSPTTTTRLVSINSAGTASGNGDSVYFLPVLSANGRFVVFDSNASDLVANDTNGATDVFVRPIGRGRAGRKQ